MYFLLDNIHGNSVSCSLFPSPILSSCASWSYFANSSLLCLFYANVWSFIESYHIFSFFFCSYGFGSFFNVFFVGLVCMSLQYQIELTSKRGYLSRAELSRHNLLLKQVCFIFYQHFFMWLCNSRRRFLWGNFFTVSFLPHIWMTLSLMMYDFCLFICFGFTSRFFQELKIVADTIQATIMVCDLWHFFCLHAF